MPLRVLFVVPGATGSASPRYRCGHFAEALALRGHSAQVVSATESAAIGLDTLDVLVLHRLADEGLGQRLIDAAHSAGTAVVYGADDLIFEPEYAYQVGLSYPDDSVRYHYHRGEGEAARRLMLRCDAALVSTEFLAARTRAALEGTTPKPVHVLRNVVSREILTLSSAARERWAIGFPTDDSEPDDRLTLGYLSGSPTHDGDLADIAPALADALERHPAARLLIVGPVTVPPALQKAADTGRIRRHPFVPYIDLPGLLAGIDINLAPLDTTRPFNHAKSEVKWLEAACVGVPTLAGDAVGFAEGVRNGEDCVLVRRRADWPDALDYLMGDSGVRAKLGGNARGAVEAHATVDALADSVEQAFTEFAALGRMGSKGSAVVRQPARVQIERRFRAVEEGILRRWIRWRRHLRLLGG